MQSDYKPLDRAIIKAAKELKLDNNRVNKIYRAYCKLIKQKLVNLPLKQELTEDEFNNLQTNVNLPSLGKLYTNWILYTNREKKLLYVQKVKENKANKHRLVSYNESL